MSQFFTISALPGQHCLAAVPPIRGRQYSAEGGLYSRGTLPDDAIGSTTVEFSGINADSEIRVYFPDATEAAGVENCTADPALSWSVFSAGSANNTVRIVIIHPDYKIKEFEYVSSVGNQSIPVQQERDMWYSNPV